jgi:predicted Zn-dependent protease
MIATTANALDRLRELLASGEYAELIRISAASPSLFDSDEAAFHVALAHIYSGDGLAGEPILRLILARNPNNFDAKAALCKLLAIDGREAAADEFFQSLEHDASRDPRAAHLLGDAYIQARRITDAHRVFSALRQATGHPAADVGRAETLLRMGRVQEAEAAARRVAAALGMPPPVLQVLGPVALCAGDDALLAQCMRAVEALPRPHAVAMFDIWTELLAAADRLAEAAFTCQKLVDLAESSERLRLLCDLKLSSRDLDGAIAAAERARARDPRDAQSMVMLARCRIVGGDIKEAIDLLVLALAADPDCVAGYDILSQVNPALVDADMRGRMSALLAKSVGLPAGDRPRLALALGRTAETNGDYAAAFALYLEAKQDIARVEAAAGHGYDPSATAAGLNALISAFREPLRRPPARAELTTHPIFIVGMPRSGTSLIEQVFSGHPNVYGGGELPTMVKTAETFVRLLMTGANARKLIEANGPGWANGYIAALPVDAAGRSHVTDKHPINFWSIGLIAELFPGARIIHASRNAMDTCLSIFKQRFFHGYSFANDIEALAHYYVAYERMMAHWRRIYPDILEVNYETLVTSFESSARALVAACGLPWDNACLEFHQVKRPVFTHSAAQVRSRANVAAVERWRKFGESLKPLQDALDRHRANSGA